MCCGGFGSPGSGGGTGNVIGTFTPTFLPVATAIHTLADSIVSQPVGDDHILTEGYTVDETDAEVLNIIRMARTASAGPGSEMQRADGSLAAPTAVLAADELAHWKASGYDGADYLPAVDIVAIAEDAPAGGFLPGKAEVRVSSPSSTLDLIMTMHWAYVDFMRQIRIRTTTKNYYSTLAIAAGAVAIDAALSDWFDLALTGNATLSAPTNPDDGRKFMIRVRSSGAFTLSYNAVFRFSGNAAPSVTPSATSYLYFVWNEIDSKWDELGEKLNFA